MEGKLNHMSFGKKNNRIDVFHMNKPWKKGLVGMIESKLFKGSLAFIVNDALLNSDGVNFACLAVGKDKIVWEVVVSHEVFYDFKRGSPMARTIILHEIGHYYHRYIKGSFDTEPCDSERVRLAEQGEVISSEIDADAFAAGYLGTEKVIQGLQMLQEKIKQICEDDLPIVELNSRICHLRENQNKQ